jgi:hypothetical protein
LLSTSTFPKLDVKLITISQWEMVLKAASCVLAWKIGVVEGDSSTAVVSKAADLLERFNLRDPEIFPCAHDASFRSMPFK